MKIRFTITRSSAKTIVALLMLGSLFGDSLVAQETKNEKPQADLSQLIAALKDASTKQNLLLDGTLKVAKPEREFRKGHNVIQVRSPNDGNRPIEGRFQVLLRGNGEILAASEAELPGFELWQVDGKPTVRSFYDGDEKFSADNLSNQLQSIFDWQNLILQIEKAEKIESKQVGSGIEFKCELPKQLIKPAGSASPITPVAVRVLAEFRVSGGSLTDIAITVVESDPVGAIVAKLMAGNSSPEQIDTKPGQIDVKPDHSTEGKHWKFEFKVSGFEPSQRIAALLTRTKPTNK